MSGQQGFNVGDETERIEEQVDLQWVCDDCGAVHRKNNPPCNDCNSMSLSAVEPDADDEELAEASKFGLL